MLHDLALAAAWADRVLVLDGGRVAALGAPAEVLTAELLSRVYEHPVDVSAAPRHGRACSCSPGTPGVCAHSHTRATPTRR